MSDSKSSGIYSITSKVNGKRYIGSSNRICERWSDHRKELKSNKHHSQHLQNHYNKYGLDDLLFVVVEIVNRGDLSLQDFKNLLLQREQVYLDSWEECHFNSLKTAGSRLGYRKPDSKSYSFKKNRGTFRVYFVIDSKTINFGTFKKEEDAIKEVSYVKNLSDKDKFKYYETTYKGNGGTKQGHRYSDTIGYYYCKTHKKWYVKFQVDGIKTSFGSFKTEEEAQQKAEQIKKEIGGFG